MKNLIITKLVLTVCLTCNVLFAEEISSIQPGKYSNKATHCTVLVKNDEQGNYDIQMMGPVPEGGGFTVERIYINSSNFKSFSKDPEGVDLIFSKTENNNIVKINSLRFIKALGGEQFWLMGDYEAEKNGKIYDLFTRIILTPSGEISSFQFEKLGRTPMVVTPGIGYENTLGKTSCYDLVKVE